MGIQFFRDGIFHIAAAAEDDVVYCTLGLYGLGRMLPKRMGQDLLDGAMLNGPAVLSIGEPLTVPRKEGEHHGAYIKRLNRTVWGSLWRGHLGAVQAAMNEASA